ncbi:ElyC/SanA/YdcF family protein [Nocardia sp. NPDC023852]|uniref:SanA/YdcF family protein n=1 Tax=Nocardia sp. NPDC023852 TaxID=3154697 RepID=UPI00340FAB6A
MTVEHSPAAKDDVPAEQAPKHSRKTWQRRIVGAVAILVVMGIVVLAACIATVRLRAAGHSYAVATVPAAPVAIIPGAQIDPNGQPSRYLARRLDLGAQLLAEGKVRALLLTGDFGRPDHNEPETMKRYLIEHGVPTRKIALDYAGFDTYSSCTRAYRIFGVRRAIVVTQEFSLPRTVSLCRSAGIATDGVGDTGQPHNTTYWRNWTRDQLASTKAVWDILTQPDPQFLGPQEHSVTDAIDQ